MANTVHDPWLKVLEDRVENLKIEVELREKNGINKAIAEFKKWVETASDVDIYYEAEERGNRVTKQRELYKAKWDEYRKAKAELEYYKETVCES